MNEGEVRQLAQMYALVADMNAVLVSVEGMKAENQQRIICGDGIAYDDRSFNGASREIDVIAERLRDEI